MGVHRSALFLTGFAVGELMVGNFVVCLPDMIEWSESSQSQLQLDSSDSKVRVHVAADDVGRSNAGSDLLAY
jgi:hypothetical protein